MINLNTIVNKAKSSNFYLWLLNLLLNRIIPFNRPHGFKVVEVSDCYLKSKLPYKKHNLNHIKGLHACAMATLVEFTSGLVLLNYLDPSKYRIILKKLEMDYLYQGKVDAFASFELTKDFIDHQILLPLQNSDSVEVKCNVKIFDKNENHLSSGNVIWQLKDWKKVKTKKQP